MKKTIIIIIAVIILTAFTGTAVATGFRMSAKNTTLVAGAAVSSTKKDPAVSSNRANGVDTGLKREASAEYIGEDAAKTIAYNHAGLTQEDIDNLVNIECHLDMENGKVVYEVEFDLNLVEYNYDIDAVTGEVISFHQDTDNDHDDDNNPTPAPEYIGADEAKAIAYNHAGLTQEDIDNLVNVECHLDRENGIVVYEIEFDLGRVEYDYDIDAITGEVISFHQDNDDDNDDDDDDNDPAPAPEYIGEDAAKAIAYNHAGLTQEDIDNLVNVECHLDRENGIVVYEIEFDLSRVEYDYDIDAITGEVISFHQDNDDDHDDDNDPAPAPEYIGEDAVIAIVLARVPGVPENAIRIHLDYEDGRAVYEVEFIFDGNEYEAEIDALTGEVLDWDVEHEDD